MEHYSDEERVKHQQNDIIKKTKIIFFCLHK